MSWQDDILHYEREAHEWLVQRGAPSTVSALTGWQPRDRIEWAAKLVINNASWVRKEAERGRIDIALDHMLSLCQAYEEFWIGCLIPGGPSEHNAQDVLHKIPELQHKLLLTSRVRRALAAGMKSCITGEINGYLGATSLKVKDRVLREARLYLDRHNGTRNDSAISRYLRFNCNPPISLSDSKIRAILRENRSKLYDQSKNSGKTGRMPA